MAEMRCVEVVERVTDYLDGALGGTEVTRLDDHRQWCVDCDAYLGEVRTTVRLLSSLDGEQLSADLERTLLSTYRAWAGDAGP